LIVEFSGDQPSALKNAARQIAGVVTIIESREGQDHVWNVRKVGLGIMDSRPRSARPVAFIEDCAIPVERLGEFIREVEQIMSAHNTAGGIYAHASAGCLHIRPILDLQQGEGVRALRSIGELLFALTIRLAGSMSSEHGDGIAAGEWIEKTYGNEVTDAMRMLKQAADPHNLLNPNKLFDAPPMDSHLRFGEMYRAQTWLPSLRFEHERGLAGAIEHCNGQGVCIKSNGLMCPSYQATREEMHSTRGRANLLRALITNHSSRDISSVMRNDDLTESVAQALDLCLACKGCKAECPSGVDMAKLKFEFENEYYKTHRRLLRDYIFGYFHLFAKLGSVAAPLLTAVMQIPLINKVITNVLKITDKRPFPKFATHKPTVNRQPLGIEKIIFLSDPFGSYFEPQVEQAAFDVLSACSYSVQVLPVVGAGASLLSKGFVDAAKRHAGKVLDALIRVDPKNEAAIVGIEPPDIYTLKHDYFDLLPDRANEVASYASRTWLLDEYLLRSENFSALRVGRKALNNLDNRFNRNIKFHPHCHQRAEGLAPDGFPNGAVASCELLRMCGFEVEVLDAGCCGMAGTFGYEAEHYELSMQVGGLKLFPLLRDSIDNHQEFSVAGTGAACRMQILQGTGLDVRHPIELVRDIILSQSPKEV
jgi:Fe-S oxidoreductase